MRSARCVAPVPRPGKLGGQVVTIFQSNVFDAWPAPFDTAGASPPQAANPAASVPVPNPANRSLRFIITPGSQDDDYFTPHAPTSNPRTPALHSAHAEISVFTATVIGLLQRVTDAEVRVNGSVIASIGAGLVVLVGVVRDDDERDAERLAERLVGYRVFADDEGRMNRSLRDAGGGLLAVPQFTLAADTKRGRRPSFGRAAEPARGRALFEHFCRAVQDAGVAIRTGEFGADMQVQLTNDGPVTFWLSTRGG